MGYTFFMCLYISSCVCAAVGLREGEIEGASLMLLNYAYLFIIIVLQVVSVRQLERQSARERERSREHLETIEQDHKLQIRQLEQDLRAVESDRNLLMATLRQEGLVGKYKAQRTAPRELEDATGGSGMQRSGQRESGVGGATLQSLPKGVEGVPRQTTGSNIEHTQLKRSDKGWFLSLSGLYHHPDFLAKSLVPDQFKKNIFEVEMMITTLLKMTG